MKKDKEGSLAGSTYYTMDDGFRLLIALRQMLLKYEDYKIDIFYPKEKQTDDTMKLYVSSWQKNLKPEDIAVLFVFYPDVKNWHGMLKKNNEEVEQRQIDPDSVIGKLLAGINSTDDTDKSKAPLRELLKAETPFKISVPGIAVPKDRPGEIYDSLRENANPIFIADPYYINSFAGFLKDDIKFIANSKNGWKTMPKILILPILSGLHWYCVRVILDYDKKTVSILWDDPYGINGFKDNVKNPLEKFLKEAILFLFKRQLADKKLKITDFSITETKKAVDQQGFLTNGCDSGPIIFKNVEDYCDLSITNEQFADPKSTNYSMTNADAEDHEGQIKEIRKAHNDLYENVKLTSPAEIKLKQLEAEVESGQQSKVNELKKQLKKQSFKPEQFDDEDLEILIDRIEAIRTSKDENEFKKDYSLEEIEEAYKTIFSKKMKILHMSESEDETDKSETNLEDEDYVIDINPEASFPLSPLRMLFFRTRGDLQKVISYSVPERRKTVWGYEKMTVDYTDEKEVIAFLGELTRRDGYLKDRINNCETTIGYTSLITVLVIALLKGLQDLLRATSGIQSEASNQGFGYSFVVVAAITAFIEGICKKVKSNAADYRVEVERISGLVNGVEKEISDYIKTQLPSAINEAGFFKVATSYTYKDINQLFHCYFEELAKVKTPRRITPNFTDTLQRLKTEKINSNVLIPLKVFDEENQEWHWALFFVDYNSKTFKYFDPLGKAIPETLKKMVEEVFYANAPLPEKAYHYMLKPFTNTIEDLTKVLGKENLSKNRAIDSGPWIIEVAKKIVHKRDPVTLTRGHIMAARKEHQMALNILKKANTETKKTNDPVNKSPPP